MLRKQQIKPGISFLFSKKASVLLFFNSKNYICNDFCKSRSGNVLFTGGFLNIQQLGFFTLYL
jgi:hypothetical protein